MPAPDITRLASVLADLAPRDRSFAESLISAARSQRYGLTAGQAPWVGKLIARAAAARMPAAVPDNAVTVGNFAAVINLFKTAAQTLKYPKVRLALPDGSPVILSVAGAQSKAPGTVNVMGEGSYPNRAWYGRVQPDGTWEPARQVNTDTLTALAGLLRDFATAPADVAAAYGRAYGNCCFCQRELTDARSVSVGYGPVCAEHYGLPWGETFTRSETPAVRPVVTVTPDDPISPAAAVSINAMGSQSYTVDPWKPTTRAEVSPAVSAFIDSIDYEPAPAAPRTARPASAAVQSDIWGLL